MPDFKKEVIILIGPMGAGKSVVGALLAESLGYSHCDTDAMVEASCGMSIPQIFEHQGEADFRLHEEQALKEALSMQRVVISTGGGVVLSQSNQALMAETGWVVYLSVSAATSKARCEVGGDTRPLLARFPKQEDWESFLQEREPFYTALADMHFCTNSNLPGEIATGIEKKWETIRGS